MDGKVKMAPNHLQGLVQVLPYKSRTQAGMPMHNLFPSLLESGKIQFAFETERHLVVIGICFPACGRVKQYAFLSGGQSKYVFDVLMGGENYFELLLIDLRQRKI